MIDFANVSDAVGQIRQAVEKCTVGWKNGDALKGISEKVFTIRHGCGGDVYILEKLGIEAGASKLYSPRKAVRYGGSDEVKGRIYIDCQNIIDRLRRLEREKQLEHN